MSREREYVWPHLAALPAFRTLIRSIEHRLLDDFKPYKGPVLDVGAGDGHFAAAALGPRLDVGVDISIESLREAQRYPVYDLLLTGSATTLPLLANQFATVISNCVIEHIPDLDATLSEMYRTLQPGGTLLLTVPTDQLERNLVVPQVLRALGLQGIASAYTEWFRRVQVHFHLLSRQDWMAALRKAGFEVRSTRGYMSRRATRIFELLHYAGWHNVIARKLTGRWVIWPWRPRFFLSERLLAGFVAEAEHEDDSCFFIVAYKP